MATVVLGLRMLLAVVFLTAGVGKLLDLQGSRDAVAAFGVPERAARLVGLLLPLAELAVGLALIFRPSARVGAVGAVILLGAFIAGIARALSRGEQPDCHCFGQIHSAPAGRGTLARNGVLAAFAVVIVAYGTGPALDAWVDARSAAELAAVGAGIFAVAAAAYALTLRVEVGRLTRELGTAQRASAVGGRWGLPVGSEAPAFALADMRGGTSTLEDLLEPGLPVLLMFMSPWCGPCASLVPKVEQWQQSLSERLTIGVISTGTPEQNAKLEEQGLENVLLQEEMEVAEMYRVAGTPSAVLVAGDGKIATNKGEMESGIEPLVRVALRRDLGVTRDGSVA